jgi:A/G-specific adenine glycosylase
MSKISKTADVEVGALGESAAPGEERNELAFSAAEFRRKLGSWYRVHARDLPWRGIEDPYATWLSEIMLQQTRVATVVERYGEFLRQFPTIRDLAEAEEADVLSLWSGLGYYRRARMLHRGAQFVERELRGLLPRTAAELRKLPGVGEYTAAAIASIAFGENVAVLDGNVERVLLRLLGEGEEKSAKARTRLTKMAQELAPPAPKARGGRRSAEVLPREARSNPAGDHNQAMMELGATICLPRAPLCLQCPVYEFCRTRGAHVTATRAKMQSRQVAYVLALRKRGVETEVLLEHRSMEASLMPGMLELPLVSLEAVEGREPALRLRHAITNTNYYVEIFTENVMADGGGTSSPERSMVEQVAAAATDLEWVASAKLPQLPLTGLARKALQRLQVMAVPEVRLPRSMPNWMGEPILAATDALTEGTDDED